MTEVKKRKQKKDHLVEYSKVVEVSELEAVTLLGLDFKVKPRFFVDREKVELAYGIEVGEHKYEGAQAFAFINCNVTATVEEDVVYSCEAKYMVVYSLSEECNEKSVGVFLKRVAVFACYPYFRANVAAIDWSAATNLPPLPIHREAD